MIRKRFPAITTPIYWVLKDRDKLQHRGKRIIKPEEFAYLKDVVCVFPNGYKRLQKANYYEDT